jgi:hypothetical protein
VCAGRAAGRTFCRRPATSFSRWLASALSRTVSDDTCGGTLGRSSLAGQPHCPQPTRRPRACRPVRISARQTPLLSASTLFPCMWG